ncbi:extensin [Streptomyces vinaceus]|uniref:extensin n=1 Tax=Streptomyces vinaceus TaxID=1960 RepID=UPI00381943AE
MPGAGAAERVPLRVAPLSPPPAPGAAAPALPAGGAARAPSGDSAPAGPTVQRFPSFGFGSGSRSRSGRAIGALAAAASAGVAQTLGHLQPSSQSSPPAPPAEPLPPYEPAGGNPPSGTAVSAEDPPPEYTAIAPGAFDPRDLTDFQLDELVHRIIGRVTRLVRTELRMDRERIGRLRDPRA